MSRKLQLELLEHHPIRDAASGLNEPSGLALDRQGTSLYTVSDDTRIIFNLDLQGRIIPDLSFLINVKDSEACGYSRRQNDTRGSRGIKFNRSI